MARRERSPRRRVVGSVLIGVLVLGGAACGGGTGDDVATDERPAAEAGPVGLTRTPPLDVGGVVLPAAAADGTTTPFPMRAAEGELLLVYFGYTSCPDICPTTLADLRTALADPAVDAASVDAAFVTVDAPRDTPERMHQFLDFFFERFHVLRTEDPAELVAAEEAFLATSSRTERPDGTIEVVHSGTAYVVDETGTVLLEWPFGTSASSIAADLARLQTTQGAGTDPA